MPRNFELPDDSTSRVLFVVTGLGWGGAESQVIDLATRMQKSGWQTVVATLLDGAERRSSLEARGVPVHTLGMQRGVPDVRAVLRLARLVRDVRPAVVHSHMVHANLLCRISRLIAPMPVLISTGHNVDEGAAWRLVAYRLTDRLANLTTNVSEAAVLRTIARRGVPAERIRCMPNGVDLGRFRPNPLDRSESRDHLGIDDRFVWLTVASLEDQKDYPNLLRATAAIADHASRPLVLAVGDGPRRAEIARAASDLGVDKCVRLLGHRDDVQRLMNAADGFVLSSAWEGLPMVLLEAAASELPIVATDVGGNSEIVEHGETGELVPPANAQALGDAMARMMESSQSERQRLGSAGYQRVHATFGLDEVVDRWLDLYSELLETATALDG